MYDDLVKRLNAFRLKEDEYQIIPVYVSEIIGEAVDAIEELSAFKEQITDGHMYCMRDGILYEAKLNPPKGKSIKLPPIKFAEPPEEEV